MNAPTSSTASSARDTIALAITIAALAVVYAVLSRVAMHAFPLSGDEYSYLFQAQLFARGLLHSPTPPHPELLRVDHVILEPWVCSKYPPGTAALLALGVRLGAPWLVTPIEGVVTLLAMAAAARRLLSPRQTLLAVAFLGISPLFAFQAGSFYSHTATTMWLTIAFAEVMAWLAEGRSWRLLVAGAALGCAFITRPVDALFFGVALLSLGSVRAVVLVAAAAFPFALILPAYQAALFGSPFTDGYTAYEPTFRAIYGARAAAAPLSLKYLVDPEQLWHHFDIVRAFIIDWTAPGTALLALFGWIALADVAHARVARRFATTLLLLFAVTLFLTIGGTDDGARPRYLSTVLLPMAWLAAVGWGAANSMLAQHLGPRTRTTLGVLVWVVSVLQILAFIIARTPVLTQREGLTRATEKLGVEGVVVVRTEFPTRYARNGPFFDGRVLYVSAPAGMSVGEVAAAFPGRRVYEAINEGENWTVRPGELATSAP